jgi:hypothetical protein
MSMTSIYIIAVHTYLNGHKMWPHLPPVRFPKPPGFEEVDLEEWTRANPFLRRSGNTSKPAGGE